MRILVADDEPIEREALRVLVQRHLPEVQVVGEACTGRQAVELAEALRPDVIFMDIEMPGLSGLEALQEIRERNPGVRCLMVSAYDYFHFARDSMRLGAVDYLLKPVKRDQMVAVLQRLSQEIAQERQRRQDDLMRKEHLRQLRPLAEAELAGLLTRGEAGTRAEALLQLLGLRFKAGLCMAVGLGEHSIDPNLAPSDRLLKSGEAYQYLRSLAHSLSACAVGNWNEEYAALLIELEEPVDEYEARLWSSELGRRIRDRVKDQTGVRFRVGIGRPCAGPAGLAQSHQEALAAFRFQGVSEKVNHYGDLQGQGQEALTEFAQLAESGTRWRPTPAVLRAVERGKAYLREHYADEDLSLERVAQEVALTPYYYSKIFSRVVGETLVDHITGVRVEEAKKMLSDPAVSIKEACFAVGYNDPNYFSRVFKKVTGQTPTEFRSQLA